MEATDQHKYVLKIGSKGEIFPPKEVREKLGLEKNQKILLTIQNDSILIRKIYSIEEILEEPEKVTISYHALREIKNELGADLEK
jgi:AbrB family looped-hinge helix DNA binding protein